jgi:hypothetical protein
LGKLQEFLIEFGKYRQLPFTPSASAVRSVIMPEYQQYQLQLLDLSRRYATESGTPLAEAIAEAFLATPHHRFVTRYRQWGQHDWQMVTDATLADHLPTLYSNDALMLWNDGRAFASFRQNRRSPVILRANGRVCPQRRKSSLACGMKPINRWCWRAMTN